MAYVILTNNNTFDSAPKGIEIQRVEGLFKDVLLAARKLIHLGYKLEVSPLPASHRMLLSPVRTLVLSEGTIPDQQSMMLIEKELDKYQVTMGVREPDMRNLNDYEFVDKDLALSALEELGIKIH